jgi:hypothetical protein
MMNMQKKLFIGFLIIFSFLFFKPTLAAQLFFFPSKGDLITDQQLNVSIKIKTDGEETLNAIQGKINFDKDQLEVTSISRGDSSFNLWIQDPIYSNKEGTIEFIAGVAGGISGSSLQVIEVSFRAKNEGVAMLNFDKNESKIAANDGLGTDILSMVLNATFKILPTPLLPIIKPGIPTPLPTPPPPPPVEQVPPPIQIERPIIISKKLPEIPELKVILYPDQAKWYNKISSFLVKWELPEDIIGISTAINKNPVFDLKTSKDEGLFDAKIFPALDNGLNFLHVQFKNTQGWGKIAHYKIAIDTMPAFDFDLSVKEGSVTDNPQPILMFMSSDQLSGTDHYQIRIPEHEPINTQETTYKLPLLEPGNHEISVRAYDKAGNISESNIQLNILPITSPDILFFDKEIFIGTESLSLKGRSSPNGKILIHVKKITGETFFFSTSEVNNEGFWEAVLTPSFKKETYYLEVKAQDERGALSLPVKSSFIQVREKPIFVIGNFEITTKIFFGGIIIILLSGFLSGFLFFRNKVKKKEELVAQKIIIAEKDLLSLFKIIMNDLEKALKAFDDKKIDKNEVIELELYLKRIKEKINNTKKYIIEGIEEIDN